MKGFKPAARGQIDEVVVNSRQVCRYRVVYRWLHRSRHRFRNLG